MKAPFKKSRRHSELRRAISLLGCIALSGTTSLPAMAQTAPLNKIAEAIKADSRLPTLAAMAGLSVSTGPDCNYQPNEQNNSVQCLIKFTEGEAGVMVRIFERPLSFDNIDAGLANKFGPKDGQKFFSMVPTIKGETEAGGPSDQAVAPGNCHQSRGKPNGAAICSFLVDGHIVIFSTVGPNTPEASLANDPNAAEDMERAQKAAFVGLALTMAALPAASPQVKNDPNNSPATAQPVVAKGSALLFNASTSSSSPIKGEVAWLPVNTSADTVLNGSAGFTGTRLKIAVDISRNKDKTVPTNQIINIKFNAPDQPVREVPAVLVRRGDQPHGGTALHGVTARIINNVALFAASEVPAEVADNLALLGSAGWIDFPVIYDNGQKGVISLAINDTCRNELLRIFSN